MNYLQMQEEFDAMNAAADRFDGFDCGDLDRGWEDARLEENLALLAEILAEEGA